MKVKVKAVPTPKKTVDVQSITLQFDTNCPKQLAETMSVWKYLGNKWLTCMEASLELDSKNMSTEVPIDINAVRALVFMEYMTEKLDGNPGDVWVKRYRLSKKGQKALGIAEPETSAVMEPKKVSSLPEKTTGKPESVECELCDGTGEYRGQDCPDCDGIGEINETVGTKSVDAVVKVKVRRK